MNKTLFIPVYRVGQRFKMQCLSTGAVFEHIHGATYLTLEAAQKHRQELLELGLYEDMWEIHEDTIFLANDCTPEDIYKAIQKVEWDSKEVK